MSRSSAPRSELPLTLVFFGLTTILTLAAASACLNDSFFRSMITLARQSDLLAQRYFGEMAAEQIFADAWRGMQQVIPFRVELVEDGVISDATAPRRDWGLTLSPLDTTVKVMAVSHSSPFQGSLRPNDEILSVDDVSAGLLAKFSEYLNDRESTLVTLRILRNELPESLQVLVLSPSADQPVRIDSVESLLYIEVRRLARDASGEAVAILEQSPLSSISGLIVDLRGVRSSAYSVAESIQHQLERIGSGRPMMVLIDGNTVGAGEELALKLREKSNARLIGSPTAGIDSKFEEVRLRSGRRLLVSIDEQAAGGLVPADTTGAGPDSLSQAASTPGAVLPDIDCREPRLSALTFELIHRGLILDFVADQSGKMLPSIAEEEQVFAEFREFLQRRQFRFDPLGDALSDLSIHDMPREMWPIYKHLKETKASLDETHLEDYRDEIMRQLLQTWHRVQVGGDPRLSDRVRFDDHCLAEAFNTLRTAE